MPILEETHVLVTSLSDRSVGIFPFYWEIRGDLSFESVEEKEKFRSAIFGAFYLITEIVGVEFGSEIQ